MLRTAALATLGVGESPELDPAVAEQVEIAAKYQGYIDRQQDEVEKSRAHEETRLPNDIDYLRVRGLSKEVQLKLNQHRPETVGQAARIQGSYASGNFVPCWFTSSADLPLREQRKPIRSRRRRKSNDY